MLKHYPQLFKKIILAFLILPVLAASGCAQRGAQAQPDESPAAVLPEPEPSSTPSADRVVLIAPDDADPLIVQDAEIALRDLAAGSGLEYEKRPQAFANEISADIKVLVFLNQPDNLGSLAASSPATQFVSLTDQDWNPGQNVTVIRKRDDHIAFMAGYLAAMLAPNFRVGALLSAENPVEQQAFINGVYYYCGLCASKIFPENVYPVTNIQPSSSPPAAWQTGFDTMNASKVNILYVAREAASPDLMAYLATQDVAMLGRQTPPEEGKPRWVATIYADGITPIRSIWQDLMDGKGGKALNAALKIADNQYVSVGDGLVWLSQGKLEYAQKTMDLLRDDQINPLPVN